jgi:hypothetical protein
MHACSLLRIAECVLLVGRYITSRNRTEFGAVCGAFADAVRDLLVDWKLYVSTLEKDLKGNGEWNLIRIMSSCQQVVDPLYTTACADSFPVLMRTLLLCVLRCLYAWCPLAWCLLLFGLNTCMCTENAVAQCSHRQAELLLF